MARETNRYGATGSHAGGRKSPIIDGIDALLALVLFAICAFFYWQTYGFDAPGAFLGENVLPEHFPRLLLVSIGGMALLLPFEHRLEVDRWPLIEKSRSAPIGLSTVLTMGFLVVLVALSGWLGTILTILVAALGLPLLWGERRVVLILVYALVFTSVVTWLFSIVLSVYFEPGVFGLTLR
ncbi:MAG: tripartite tricarboxylate transporter TctB family protein [Rhodobacteraceae bacterium]|nr:tripartite tricarboxylate transporter TctB family protein [Paracoccaceae bacterium]